MKRRLNGDAESNSSKLDISKKQTTTPQDTMQDSSNVEEKVAAQKPPDSHMTLNNNQKEQDCLLSYSDDDDEYSYHSSSSCGSQDSPENAISLTVSNQGHCFCGLTQIKSIMDTTIQDTTDLLGIPPQAALVILRHYQWNIKLLTDNYFSTPEEIQQTCGVYHRCQPATSTPTRNDSTTMTCSICLDPVHPQDVFGMPCGHDDFCKTCWNEYLQEALSRGPACVYTTCCPRASCQEVVTDLEIAKLAPLLETKFQEFLLKSYVASNPMMHWCPGVSCDCVAVGSAGDGSCPSCGTCSCLKCGHVQHSPCTCDMLELWNAKCSNDSETANWMLCKTKSCPKCDTRIDKNGGCHHMRCSQCQFHFCWLCMQDWKVHGYERSCNEFDLTKAQANDSARVRSERELERYLFCFQRFQNHNQGQDFCQKQLDNFRIKQQEREEMDISFDWNALQQALRQLVECRRVLKYTYVVTYSLADEPLQRQLFENHQGLLERFTEQLSELTEMGYKQIDHWTLVNLTKTVEKYTVGVMECLDAQQQEDENDEV